MAFDEGELIITGERVTRAALKTCPHCGMFFAMIKGSGAIRSTCSRCPGRVTCGNPKCFDHVEIERKFDLVESGRMPLSAL